VTWAYGPAHSRATTHHSRPVFHWPTRNGRNSILLSKDVHRSVLQQSRSISHEARRFRARDHLQNSKAAHISCNLGGRAKHRIGKCRLSSLISSNNKIRAGTNQRWGMSVQHDRLQSRALQRPRWSQLSYEFHRRQGTASPHARSGPDPQDVSSGERHRRCSQSRRNRPEGERELMTPTLVTRAEAVADRARALTDPRRRRRPRLGTVHPSASPAIPVRRWVPISTIPPAREPRSQWRRNQHQRVDVDHGIEARHWRRHEERVGRRVVVDDVLKGRREDEPIKRLCTPPC
jgi:hypothetical protein